MKKEKSGLWFENENEGFQLTTYNNNLFLKNGKIRSKYLKAIISIENNTTIEGRYKYFERYGIEFSKEIDNLKIIYEYLNALGIIKKVPNTKTKCYVEINLNEDQIRKLNELKELAKKQI